MRRTCLIALAVGITWCTSEGTQADVTIEMVVVGSPGNAGEGAGASYGGEGPDRICGAVDYTYEIGKYEVTTNQYAAFLNAVAATDTYGLWQPSMEATPSDPTDACGIARTGSQGTYIYTVIPGNENRPVNFVSFWNACRFANWLHNGQPMGVQDATTTEDGAYTLNGYTGSDGSWIVRNPGARYFLPDEDEWYKAAYYYGSGYWDYPTQNDSPPTTEDPPGGVNSANLYHEGYATTTGSTTDVGAYAFSVGPFGTFDQAGNVGEWTDSIIGVFGGYTARGWEGGGFEGGGLGEVGSQLSKAAANSRNYYPPHVHLVDHTGFRIARLPDCDGNGIPDLCDLDCGAPGGFCDVAGCGQSEDCNSNGAPDSCDLQEIWRDAYATDFSGDPGWTTNNESHYYWLSSNGEYFINQVNINQGGEFAFHETDYHGGSFRLEWDMVVEWTDYASDVSFGMFDQDMNTKEGSFVRVMFTWADAGTYVILAAYDLDNVSYLATSLPWQFSTDTAYHVALEYDAENATLHADVFLDDMLQAALVITDFGGFSAGMSRVGTSNLRDGTFQVPGADSAGRVDNVMLRVSSADCNENGTPDECELDGNDCNSNGVPDECDLAGDDCNTNGVPDECDFTDPWFSVYSTDFSTDPEWDTNNSANYFWQALDEDYFINQYNIPYGGEYAFHETGYRGGSFILGWDVVMDWSDYASDVSFGMFDEDMETKEGSHVRVMFTTADDGKYVILHARDSNDVSFQATSLPWHFNEDTEYHVQLVYDKMNATLKADVYQGGVLQSSLVITDVGTFAEDMNRVGTSNLRSNGTFQVPGADSAGRIDNVVLLIASADCNANQIPDECELEDSDCNQNGVPDECESDFDADGTIDDCDDDIDDDTVLNDDDVCDYSPLGSNVVLQPPGHPRLGTLRYGDVDGDCDCDLEDYALFAGDMTGPNGR